MRILVLIAIGLLLYIIISNLLRKNRTTPTVITEKMVKCCHCGIHIPRKEAVHSKDEFYCSQAHLDEHQHMD